MLLIAALLAVQWQDVDAERLPTRIYSTADGLTHNTINRIVRDSEGFLWFCTREGLSRFDGAAFRTIDAAHGLPALAVNDLLETGTGDYWVATDNGLVHLDRRDPAHRRKPRQRVSTTTPGPHRPIVPDGADQRSSAITALRQLRDGTIWVGTGNGLYRLDSPDGVPSLVAIDVGLPHAFPDQRMISDLLEDRHGTLWIGTPAGLYRRWTDGVVEHYPSAALLPPGGISALTEDREGALWVGTATGGFYRLQTDASRRPPRPEPPFSVAEGLPDRWITDLFESSDHRFWIATPKGLAELLPSVAGERRVLRRYASRQGIIEGYLGALGEDMSGNLWIGSHGAGAVKLTRQGFTIYAAHDGIQSVGGIFEDRAGNVCFRALVLGDKERTAFEGGVLNLLSLDEPTWFDNYGCSDGRRYQWFAVPGLAPWGWIRDGVTLHAQNDEWWIGTEGGLLRFPAHRRFAEVRSARPLRRYTMQDGLASNLVSRVFEDSRGNIWIATTSSEIHGLARYEARTGRLEDLARMAGLPSPRLDGVRDILEDPSGNVWLAFQTGLARYSAGSIAFFTQRDGVPLGVIRRLHIDRAGRLWLASSRGGLIRVDQPSSSKPTFVAFTVASGLSSNNLYTIAEDRDGYLYVGGGHGIDRLDPSTGRVRHFSQADGLVPGQVTAAHTDRHGVLWFGMTTGLARLVPEHDSLALPPPVFISGLRVAGEEYTVSPFGDRHVSLANLSPDETQLEVEFVGLGFAPGEVLRYQYKLEGSDWSPPTARRVVTYASLSPGDYVFSVQAVNADGVVSPAPATLAFTILRPVWQRWWFLTLSGAAVIAAAGLTLRYRVNRLLEMANMRTRIATDLHDDIGADLTRIALLSEVAQRTRDQSALVSIAAIARESVTSMSDIVWAINPRRESLLDLTRRMRQHADELFTRRGIALRFDAPHTGETRRLGVDIRRDLLLIFKEAVNNAARHSACTAVEISIHLERGRLKLTIRDDGMGFDPASAGEGNGLASMRRRAERIHALLKIERAAGSGSLVTLDLPL